MCRLLFTRECFWYQQCGRQEEKVWAGEKLSPEAIPTKNSACQESSEAGKVCPDGARGSGLHTPVVGSLAGGCHQKAGPWAGQLPLAQAVSKRSDSQESSSSASHVGEQILPSGREIWWRITAITTSGFPCPLLTSETCLDLYLYKKRFPVAGTYCPYFILSQTRPP